MHLPDGILKTETLLVTCAATVLLTGYSLRRIDQDSIPRVGVMSAVFFVSSLIHVNIGPTSAHLLLNGLMGVVLGWACVPAILVALLLQSVFFGFGGIVSLGATALHISAGALFCHLIFSGILARASSVYVVAPLGFVCGFLGVFSASALLAANLTFNGLGDEMAWFVVLGHLPVALVEGLVTAFVLTYLKKLKPEIFRNHR